MLGLKSIKFCLVILILFNYYQIHAQKKGFEVGFRLNLNIFGMYGKDKKIYIVDTNKTSGGIGFPFGPFVYMEITPKNYGIIEILYSQKGSFYTSKKWYNFSNREGIGLNYIEIPLIYGRKVDNVLDGKSIQIGLSYSKLIAINANYKDLSKRLNTLALSNFKNYDLSFLIGLMTPIDRIWMSDKKKCHYLFLNSRLSSSILSVHKTYKLYNFSLYTGIIYLI